jgi:hypothetical protein
MSNPFTHGSLDEAAAFVREASADKVLKALEETSEEARPSFAAFALQVEQERGEKARKGLVAKLEAMVAGQVATADLDVAAERAENARARCIVEADCKVVYQTQLLRLQKGQEVRGPMADYLLRTGAPVAAVRAGKE